MKRAAILSFSAQGAETAKAIAAALPEAFEAEQYAPRGNLREITADLFPAVDAMIFVGACGIAVRAVAPHLASKAEDPAVLAADEKGRFVIPLLSGHIGGANDLARQIAAGLGATPVVTTATDVNCRFAADAWAARQGLAIGDLEAARRFSAEILRHDLPMQSDFPVEGGLPHGIYAGSSGSCGLMISCRSVRPFSTTLTLTPRLLHAGIGCKRGTGADVIDAAVCAAFEAASLNPLALKRAASIDVKRDEPGLSAWAAEKRLPVAFYSAEELQSVPGEFAFSAFVLETVGVDNVCERAAMRSAGPGASLIVRKMSLHGVTVAVAQEKWSVRFE